MKFPTPHNEFPTGSKVDRLKRAIGSTGLELNCTVISGPHSNGKSDYYMVKDPNGQTNRVFPDEMRCAMHEEDGKEVYTQKKISQWVYEPEAFAKYVRQLEAKIENCATEEN